KINSSQVSSSYNGASNSAPISQAYVSREKAPAELLVKDIEHKSEQKPKSEQKLKYEAEPDEKQLIDAIEKTNKAIEGTTCSFEYSIHEQTKQIMVKVIDKKTKEVIREFPPEKILDMVAKMWEVAGIMVDERR
ncbi:MAG TPA: flagellar protein FlaG, partial [Clostridia bacterium]|nr:flagellar protein FlaG [Clostridia bacterium]